IQVEIIRHMRRTSQTAERAKVLVLAGGRLENQIQVLAIKKVNEIEVSRIDLLHQSVGIVEILPIEDLTSLHQRAQSGLHRSRDHVKSPIPYIDDENHPARF